MFEKDIKKEQRLKLQQYIKYLRDTKWAKNNEVAKKIWVSKTISSWLYKLWEKYEISFRVAEKLIKRIEVIESENVD